MVRLRKIFFVIFVIIYLILCPTLILYSLGIVIKPGRQNVVKTGIIYVSSIPSGATILLNGETLNEQTPTVINNLVPGTYTLELTARKYRSWTKDIPVAAEKVTPVENILLMPDPLNIRELSQTPSETLIPVAGNPYLMVANGPTLADILIYIWDEGISQNLLAENESKTRASRFHRVIPADSTDGTGKLVRLHTSKNSPYILFEIENDHQKKLLWIDPLFGTPKVEDVTDLFPDLPKEIEWDSNDARHLLSFQDNAINRLDLATKAIYPKILDSVEDFSLSGQDIVFLTMDGTIRKSSQTGTNQDKILDDPLFNDLVAQHFPFKRMLSVSDSVTLLLGRRGELITTLKPYLLTDRDIEGFKWNDRPPRLLVWSRHAIGFIDFSRRSESLSQELPGVIRWITQKGRDISDAFWVNDGSHILFVDDNGLFLADTGSFGPPEIQEIVKIKANSAIYYSDKIGKAFFLSQDDSLLSSIEIVPQKALLRGINFDTNKDEDDQL